MRAPIMSTPQPPPPNQTASRSQVRFVEGLSIVLTLIGLITLIELYPRLSASAKSPFNPRDRIAAFAIRNDGYFKITEVKPECFIWKATGFGTMTNLLNSNSAGMEPVKELRPTETMTIPCGITMIGPIKSVDIGVIARYRPWPFTFITKRKVFRFVAT